MGIFLALSAAAVAIALEAYVFAGLRAEETEIETAR